MNMTRTYMLECSVRCYCLLGGWELCAHDLVLLHFLLAHVLSIDSNEVEAPSSILDIIHQLVVGKVEQQQHTVVLAHTHTHTCTHTFMHTHTHAHTHTLNAEY